MAENEKTSTNSNEKTSSSLNDAIKSTVNDIQEILAKSGLAKADEPSELSEQANQEQPSGEPAPAPSPEPASPEQPSAPAEEPNPEHPEHNEEDEMAQMQQELQSMSSEELHMMREMIESELGSREDSQEGEQPAPEQSAEAPAPPFQEAPAPMEMSMKEDMGKLHKSMEAIAKSVESLAKDVAAVKAEASKPAPAAPAPRVVAKAAPMNAPQGTVLEKSTPVAQRLNKSETMAFLEGELKKPAKQRSTVINSGLIRDLVYCDTDEKLAKFQDTIRKAGVQLPS